MTSELLGTLQLPRFNMSFEAGIVYSAAAAGRPLRHMLLFEKKPCRHNASMSDAPGMDAKIHAGDPALAIEAVRDLFANQEWLGEADARGQGHAVFD